jgi:transposase
MMSSCNKCLEKDIQIYDLQQKIIRLQKIVDSQKKQQKEGAFGSSTPSSKIPVKENTKNKKPNKNGGGKKGHKGHGRKKVSEGTADVIEYLNYEEEFCPYCNSELEKKGYKDRTIIDSENKKPQKKLYKCERKRCKKCKKLFQKKPPVLDKGLYGNNLVAEACVMHYFHGIPLGRIEAIFGKNISSGSLFQVFHRIGRILKPSIDNIIDDYRKSHIKHADETGWRTDGNSGYAWIFCSDSSTIFEFKNTRGSAVAKSILGEAALDGFLVVDRYNGYNKIKCKIQYCYAHLLRTIKDLGKEFNDDEVQNFVSNMAYYLSEAMHLRNLKIIDKKYYKKAKEIRDEIIKLVEYPYKHFGIQNIQQIFTEAKDRLYHWVEDRQVPPDNNTAERELRPTVIARKVSFGSQSEKGAKTRSIIMSYLHTASKRIRGRPLEEWFKEVLDKLTENPNIDCYELLKSEKID